MKCIKCGELIPEGRLKAMPKTKCCIECSETEPYGSVVIVNHKTGNEIQIIKDKKLAEKINKDGEREGYGTLKKFKDN